MRKILFLLDEFQIIIHQQNDGRSEGVLHNLLLRFQQKHRNVQLFLQNLRGRCDHHHLLQTNDSLLPLQFPFKIKQNSCLIKINYK